jgi:hypothetical protein
VCSPRGTGGVVLIYDYIIDSFEKKVKQKLVKRLSIAVAARVRPVLVLPIADLTTLAERVGPVVPGFAPGWYIGDAVLLVSKADNGQNKICEMLGCLLVEQDFGKAGSHRFSPFVPIM